MTRTAIRVAFGAALALAAVHCVGLAHAQSSLGIGTNEATLPSTGLFAGFFNMVNLYQQEFYRSLTGALKAMRTDGSKLWLPVGLSFAYGIFHAAGPGHGKAVISSYMIANEVALRRGIVLAFISAFLQAFTAIVLISAVFLVLRGTSISMTDATWFLEISSYVLVSAFGAWLLWKKATPLFRGRPAHSLSAAAAQAEDRGSVHDHDSHPHDHGHDADDHRHLDDRHDHDHEVHGHHVHAHAGHDHAHDGGLHRDRAAPAAAALHSQDRRGHVHDHVDGDHDHRHHHGHGAKPATGAIATLKTLWIHSQDDHDHVHADGEVCETCGHSHAPDPALLSGEKFDWRTAWSALVAVGLRPCSGALIVLTFAFLNGLWAGGILSVIAMAVGTGITVAILATLAVTAKNWAVLLAGGNGRFGARIHTAVEIAGAALVLVVGLLLLTASLMD
jgi:ABC-type nickel/cobalt efflux system permease component RcnA